MKIKIPLLLVSSALVAYLAVWSMPRHRLAPAGTFYLIEGVTVTTETGVSGFWPGAKVQMVQDRGQTMIVTSGGSAFEIGVDRLTNDIDLGELAARRDAESQQALATTLQGERQAMLTAQGKSQAWFDEQQRAVSARRVAGAAALQQHRSPLDRGAYAEKENVSWRPYIYDQPYYYTYYPYRNPWTRP